MKLDLSFIKNFSLDNITFLNNLPFMNKQIYSSIFIDDDFKTIRFGFLNKDSKSFTTKTEIYKGKPFNENFYEMLKGVIALHKNEYSDKVSLVLPDTLFVTDTIKLPYIQKSALQTSLNLALDTLYGTTSHVKFNSFSLSQNKNNVVFNVCGIKKDVLTKLSEVFDECSLPLANVTFAANATVNAAMTINPKLKNSNFILLDIKEGFSRFAFVIAGKTVGFYSLPFGYEILKPDKLCNELSLFDHTAADLLVLNAQEKARKKQLTMLETTEDFADNESFDDDAIADDLSDKPDDSFDATESTPPAKSGALFKRVNRKLPKFMQRPEPQSASEFVYENFRIYIKWALELIRNNTEIFALGAPDSVVVNVPKQFSSLFPINFAGTGVEFTPLAHPENSDVSDNLELYGALSTKKFNKPNNF